MKDPFFKSLMVSAKLKANERDFFNENYTDLTDETVHLDTKKDFMIRIAEISLQRKKKIEELENQVKELQQNSEPPENQELQTEIDNLISGLEEINSVSEILPYITSLKDQINDLLENQQSGDELNELEEKVNNVINQVEEINSLDEIPKYVSNIQERYNELLENQQTGDSDVEKELENYENMFLKIMDEIPDEIKEKLPEVHENNPLEAVKLLIEEIKEQSEKPENSVNHENMIELKEVEKTVAQAYLKALERHKPGAVSNIKEVIVNYVFMHVMTTNKPPKLLPSPDTVKKIRDYYENQS